MPYDFKKGFVVYPDADPASPSAKAPFVDLGAAHLDPSRNWSPEEAQLEWDRMWTKTWQFAGLLQDIPETGDYFRIEIGRESIIVLRTGPGEQDVAAYYNVCPHRGNRIAHNDFGSVGDDGCFRCDFHGWRYDMQGRNVEIRDSILFRPEVIAHRPGLDKMRCGVWNSLVFISMAEDGISLLEHLDVMPEHLKHFPIGKFRVFRDFQVCWDANWKTALDAFLEFYHADDVHPEVIPFSATLKCQYDLYNYGLSRMIIPNGYAGDRTKNPDEVNDVLKGLVRFYGGNPADYPDVKGYDYRRAICDVKRKWGKRHGYDHFDQLTDGQMTDDWNYFVFPNITLNFFADTMLIQIFRPHETDPEKSYYRAISMNLPVPGTKEMVMDINSIGPDALSEPGWDGSIRPAINHPTTLEEFGSVLAQDAMRVPFAQKGIRSRAFKGYLLSESETRIRHYLQEIDRYIGRRK